MDTGLTPGTVTCEWSSSYALRFGADPRSRNCRIVNFFYKNALCIGVLWWFQIYCAFSTT